MWIPPGMSLRSELRETWLSDPPRPSAVFLMAGIGFLLAVLAAAYWRDWGGLREWMPASGDQVFQRGEYHRLWSTLFVHADPRHLLANLLLLLPLGYFLAGYFGVWLVPLSALFMGGLVNALVLARLPGEVLLMGISGIVFWLGGAWLTLYFLIDRKRSLSQRGIRVTGVALLLFLPSEAFDPSISYSSHALGFLFGALWALAYFVVYRSILRSRERYELILEDDSA